MEYASSPMVEEESGIEGEGGGGDCTRTFFADLFGASMFEATPGSGRG
jgi:hypothetical protein